MFIVNMDLFLLPLIKWRYSWPNLECETAI